MKYFYLICGIFLVAAGLLLLLAVPVPGIIFIAIGAFMLYCFSKTKKKPKEPEPVLSPSEDFVEIYVAGFDYRQEELKELLREENEDYNLGKKAFLENVFDRCYQYEIEYYPARLVPEDNEHDPTAIAVFVEDLKIGYIPRKDKHLIDLEKISKVEAEIYGGKYKEPSIDDDYNEIIEKGETPYKAKLYIYTQ